MYHTSFYEMRADRPYYFNIFHYMITKDSPKADDEVHYHQSLEFVYVADGVFPIHVQGETHILQKNELAYIPSGQVHYYTTLSDANVFVFIVSVDYLNDPIYGSQCLIPNIMKLSPGCAAKLESILYCLYGIWEEGNIPLAKGVFNAFYGVIRDEIPLHEIRQTESSFPIMDILKYIDLHYAENINLKNISAQFNYSETYFSSCFNAHLNMSLREYINRIRIGHVKQLMEHGKTKMQAAELCGYTNNNTFYRAYKKYYDNNIREIPDMKKEVSFTLCES